MKAKENQKARRIIHLTKKRAVELTLIGIAVLVLASLFYKVGITGLVVVSSEKTYVEEWDLKVDENSSFNWTLENTNFSEINSIRVTGKLIGDGSARMIILQNNTPHIVFDSDEIAEEQSSSPITGFVILNETAGENKTLNGTTNETTNHSSNLSANGSGNTSSNETNPGLTGSNQSINTSLAPNVTDNINQNGEATGNETRTNNTTNNTSNTTNATNTNTTNATNNTNTTKQIFIHLDYKAYNSNFDTNNDGIETENGIIDLTVANTNFNWNVNENKLCTKWELNNNQGLTTTTCNGNPQCCSLLNLAPTQNRWNAPYYTYKGKNNATNNNTITAQIIYLNQNTTNNKTPLEITYSQPQSKQAIFVARKSVSFEDVCVETCAVNFTDTNYEVRFEVSNATLHIINISYTTTQNIRVPENVTLIIQGNETIFINNTLLNASISAGLKSMLNYSDIDAGSLWVLSKINEIQPSNEITSRINYYMYDESDEEAPIFKFIRKQEITSSDVPDKLWSIQYTSDFLKVWMCRSEPIDEKFLAGLEQRTVEKFEEYKDLHVLLAYVWAKELGCYEPEVLDPLISKKVSEILSKSTDGLSIDVVAERAAVVQYAGYRIPPSLVEYLLVTQNIDGGWSSDIESSSNPHTTSLAIWALVQWRENNE